MKAVAEKILETYFPFVIADEDEWAIHVVKAMQEYATKEAMSFGLWVKENKSRWHYDLDKNDWCKPRTIEELYKLWEENHD